jgi:hypothetical protein
MTDAYRKTLDIWFTATNLRRAASRWQTTAFAQVVAWA